MQPRIQLAFWATGALCWLMFTLPSTSSPCPLWQSSCSLVSYSPAWCHPKCTCASAVVLQILTPQSQAGLSTHLYPCPFAGQRYYQPANLKVCYQIAFRCRCVGSGSGANTLACQYQIYAVTSSPGAGACFCFTHTSCAYCCSWDTHTSSVLGAKAEIINYIHYCH